MTISKNTENQIREAMRENKTFTVANEGVALIIKPEAKPDAKPAASVYNFVLDEPKAYRRFKGSATSIKDLFTAIRAAIKDWPSNAESYEPPTKADQKRAEKQARKNGERKPGAIYGMGIRAAVQWMSQQGMDRKQITAAVESAMGCSVALNTKHTINTASAQAKNPKYRIEVDMPTETAALLLAFAK